MPRKYVSFLRIVFEVPSAAHEKSCKLWISAANSHLWYDSVLRPQVWR